MQSDLYTWFVTEKVQVVISGALGGVVRWLTLQESWRTGMVSVACGAICAVYLGPLVEPVLRPVLAVALTEHEARSSFAAFVIGLSGITLSGFIIDIVRARKAAITNEVDAPK
jgi:fluoride ion exporter CrcB/FEX